MHTHQYIILLHLYELIICYILFCLTPLKSTMFLRVASLFPLTPVQKVIWTPHTDVNNLVQNPIIRVSFLRSWLLAITIQSGFYEKIAYWSWVIEEGLIKGLFSKMQASSGESNKDGWAPYLFSSLGLMGWWRSSFHNTERRAAESTPQSSDPTGRELGCKHLRLTLPWPVSPDSPARSQKVKEPIDDFHKCRVG